jgi:hypothetical protein
LGKELNIGTKGFKNGCFHARLKGREKCSALPWPKLKLKKNPSDVSSVGMQYAWFTRKLPKLPGQQS